MDRKKYKQFKVIITIFVSVIISLSVVKYSYLLSLAGILTGMVFMTLVRSKAKIKTDERETSVQEKSARITYAIFAPTLGISAILLLLPSKSGLSIFAKGEFTYIESLGMIFAYLSLFLISVYSISYHFFNKKYGGDSD